MFLWVGTGVGLGIVIDGRLYRGAYGAAGEIAYLPIGHDDPYDRALPPPRPARGGGSAPRVIRAGPRGGDAAAADAEVVFAAARRGDPAALRVVEAEAGRIALAIAAVCPCSIPSW